jgi:hypothetical protein
MKKMRRLYERLMQLYRLPAQINAVKEALGRVESRLDVHAFDVTTLAEKEFKVYSQWGEDGIIDFLVSKIPVPQRVFVEFGVENYTEANTLFLLKHRNWSGLIIDGSRTNIESIKSGDVYWRYDLFALEAFVSAENINDVLVTAGVSGDIGLLSVDIDGNDYWVWEAITAVSPRIVVCEYNSLFGSDVAVSIPYSPTFARTRASPTNMYYGASISALTHLARKKGYSLVGGNSAGNNAFFVRTDVLGAIKPVTPAAAYVKAQFREGRSSGGEVTHLSFQERRAAIGELPVVNVETGATLKVRDVAA